MTLEYEIHRDETGTSVTVHDGQRAATVVVHLGESPTTAAERAAKALTRMGVA